MHVGWGWQGDLHQKKCTLGRGLLDAEGCCRYVGERGEESNYGFEIGSVRRWVGLPYEAQKAGDTMYKCMSFR